MNLLIIVLTVAAFFLNAAFAYASRAAASAVAPAMQEARVNLKAIVRPGRSWAPPLGFADGSSPLEAVVHAYARDRRGLDETTYVAVPSRRSGWRKRRPFKRDRLAAGS